MTNIFHSRLYLHIMMHQVFIRLTVVKLNTLLYQYVCGCVFVLYCLETKERSGGDYLPQTCATLTLNAGNKHGETHSQFSRQVSLIRLWFDS